MQGLGLYRSKSSLALTASMQLGVQGLCKISCLHVPIVALTFGGPAGNKWVHSNMIKMDQRC